MIKLFFKHRKLTQLFVIDGFDRSLPGYKKLSEEITKDFPGTDLRSMDCLVIDRTENPAYRSVELSAVIVYSETNLDMSGAIDWVETEDPPRLA